MHLDSLGLPSDARAGHGHAETAQELEDWAATIALTVAATLEPSCALAFCFGNQPCLSEHRTGGKPDVA